MPIKGIADTARTLSFYLRKQEVTANNLANSSSDAFKVDRITARRVADVPYPVAVQQTDLRQGTFRDTGRSLDVALDGPGFLTVGTTGGERLFRGGSLRLDGSGRLTDAQGDAVLGTDGPIVLHGHEAQILADGSVLVDGAPAGRLRIATVDDPRTLRKEGFGRFVAAGPLQPVPEGVVRVRQGAVEEPNFDALTAMVDMITIQRAYAANLDALKTMDGVLGTITSEVGKA